jgi:IclR family transcriptional regulator, acetate operon repressor
MAAFPTNSVANVAGLWLRCRQWHRSATHRNHEGDPLTGVAASGSTRTVERALDLLAEVCVHPPVSLTECARRVGLPASTALRLLRTLESSGFVARDSGGAFRPGVRVLQLGATALGRQSLVDLAQPSLARIVEQTGESTYLVVRGAADTALYLAMAEGTHPVRHTSWVGRAIELADLAVGAALSGEVPPSGYVAQRDRIEPEITAIAAPVRRPGGIVAAINLLGPTYRINDETSQNYGRIVSQEAIVISGLLGVDSDAEIATAL